MKTIILGLAIMCSAIPAYAQEETQNPTSIMDPQSWTLKVFAGKFATDEEPQFVGMRNEYALGFGLSGDFTDYPWLGLDFEVFYVNRDYDTPLGTPLWGTIDGDTSVQTTALTFGARAFYPTQAAVQGYVSAGLGYFYTRMVAYGSVFGLPGSYEDSDTSLEFYYGAGVTFMFGNWGLSLDYRHFDLDGDFGGFGISNANLGGELYLLGWRYSLWQ